MIKKRSLVLIAALLLLAVLGQNCQDARITKSVGLFSSASDLLVKMADVTYTHRRYVFFVDMSGSMISGACPTDIDGIGPASKNVTKECVPDPSVPVGGSAPPKTYLGVDPQATRLTAIQSWLSQLDALTAEDRANVQVAIVPFTGGQMEEDRRTREMGKAKWRTIEQASAYVEILRSEQSADLLKALDELDWTKFMGTSAPVSRLQETYDLIRSDMIHLADIGALATTAYQFIYLSDGVPTPTRDLFQNALTLSGCANVASPFTCDAVTQELKVAWGDPDINTLDAVKAEFDRMDSLTKYYGEVDLTYTLVVVQPDRILPMNRTKEANFLYGLREKSNRFQLTQLETSTPPFRLKGLPRPYAIYRVTAFHAYNLNVRPDANGVLAVDSDGDGLFDYEEIAAGTDPLNPRSDGVCLDSIATNPAYKAICKAYHDANIANTLACNPRLDIDQDGLNECEEQILGTDPFDFDTDDYSVPDGLEVIYRMFPNIDDSTLDSNSDGVSNLVNFERGLMPQTMVGKIDARLMINLNKKYLGSETVSTTDGRQVDSELFSVELTSAPLMKTAGSVKDAQMYFGRNLEAATLIPHEGMILGGPSDPNVNEIVFLARVVDVDDPTRSRWLMKREKVRVGQNVSLKVDLSEMTMIRTMDRLR